MEDFEYGESETGPTFDVSNPDESNAIERIIDISAGAKEAITDSDTAVHPEVPRIIEIKSDAIITTDPPTLLDAEENGLHRKWSHSASIRFLAAFKMALKMNDDKGTFVNKKEIFLEAVHLLRKQGIILNVKEFERKYNNMLVTYKRCRRKLLYKKKGPTWPYFKDIREIEKLKLQSLNLYNIESEEGVALRKPSRILMHSKSLLDLNYESNNKCMIAGDPSSLSNTLGSGIQKYVKILPKPTVNVALLSNTSFDPVGGGPSFTTVPALPIPTIIGSLSDSFKEKRQRQEYQKLSFVDQLLQECEGASAVEKKNWTNLAAEEETECQLLSAVKDEVAGFRKDLIEGVVQVRNQLNTLAHIILNRR